MTIRTYKTKKVAPGDILYEILDASLPEITEQSVVVVTSKIVAICQGDVIKNDGTLDKHELAKSQAERYIEDIHSAKYPVLLTIKRDFLIANSGVDESNGDGYFILWPDKPDKAAADIWQHVRARYNIKQLGVILSESRTIPLRWGTLGVGLAYCGFEPLKSYIGKPDIFGRNLKMTNLSILDGLAAAAVTLMGEGNEQTPLAVISDLPFVNFTDAPPSEEELKNLRISLEDDMYSPLTNSPKWKKGG